MSAKTSRSFIIFISVGLAIMLLLITTILCLVFGIGLNKVIPYLTLLLSIAFSIAGVIIGFKELQQKKKKRIWIGLTGNLIMILLISGMTYFSMAERKQIDSTKWIADLEKFRTELPQNHKNLFFQLDQHKFDSLVFRIENNIDSLDDNQILLKLKQIISKIGDTHTDIVNLKDKMQKNKYLPIAFEWFHDSLRIVSCSKENKDILGHKLIAINKIPITEIIDTLKCFYVCDNEAATKIQVPRMLQKDIYLKFLNIINEDTLELKLYNIDGEIIVRRITLAQKKKSGTIKVKSKLNPLYLLHRNKAFWGQYIEKDNVFYIQYNTCASKDMYQNKLNTNKSQLNFFEKILLRLKVLSTPSFSKFTSSMLGKIDELHPKKVIIDLRFNSGGSSDQGKEFAKQLSKYTDIQFYVITGRKTFSSAINNTYDFKNIVNATIVGESTCGKPCHYGEIKLMKLPNSGLKLQYSTRYIKSSNCDSNTINPDITIELTYDDYVRGIDPVYEFIKNKTVTPPSLP